MILCFTVVFGRDITEWNPEQEISTKPKFAPKTTEEILRERTGLFVGFGVGATLTKLGVEQSIPLGYGSSGDLITDNYKINVKDTSANIGIMVGGQFPFNIYSGLRVYGTFDMNLPDSVIYQNITSDYPDYLNDKTRIDSIMYHIAANLDFYVEGDVGESETLGVFAGLGIGYAFWQGKGTLDGNITMNDGVQYGPIDIKVKIHQAVLSVNLGLRSVIANHHVFELAMRMYPGWIDLSGGGISNLGNVFDNTSYTIRYSYLF